MALENRCRLRFRQREVASLRDSVNNDLIATVNVVKEMGYLVSSELRLYCFSPALDHHRPKWLLMSRPSDQSSSNNISPSFD